MKSIFPALLIMLLSFSVTAQPNIPDAGPVFIDTEVPRIDITINPDTLAWIYENVNSDIEFHADFHFTSSEIDESFEDIGFRLRGNTSRNADKKSFKVSFNTFVDGGDFYGLEKLNLNGEHNDPSVSRSKIGWDLARRLGLASSRANHVELYINGNYHGLYLNVEHVDEEFTNEYFDTKTGNLYKCLWPADLVWKGSNPDYYKEEHSGRRAYDLKINEDIDDYTDLRDFIGALNNSSDQALFHELNAVFNTQDYLKYMAFEVLIGHWDDYSFNKNNYYLYHNPETDKFEFILYDLDNTMGIDWFGITWSSRNIYSWSPDWEERPLYERLMNNEIFRNQYTYYVKEIIEIISDPQFENYILALKDRIRPYVIDDPYYPLDYGYSIESFDLSFTGTVGAHVKKGILPYLSARSSSANSQLENTDMHPLMKYAYHNAPGAFSAFRVRVYAIDDQPDMTVFLNYQIDGGEQQQAELFDDGLHGDFLAGDNIYGGNIDPVGFAATLGYNIVAMDNNSQETTLYAENYEIEIAEGGNYPLFINELMADNETVIADEYGEYEDWIELWNAGENPINLNGMYLSDDPDMPNKWMCPDITIAPGEFLLFWADNDEEQGETHMNFKLSKDGEFVGLYDVEASGYALIDDISFGPLADDTSYGREEDGAVNWIVFNESTPGSTNNTDGLDEFAANSINVFPVPASNTLFISMENEPQAAEFVIYDISGREVHKITMDQRITPVDISSYSPGVYLILNSTNSQVTRFIKQ